MLNVIPFTASSRPDKAVMAGLERPESRLATHDSQRKPLKSSTIPTSYSIRQAEKARTIFTGLTWLEVSLFAFGDSIYNANVFDRDIVGGSEVHVKDNYSNYAYGKVAPMIAACADQAMQPPPPLAEEPIAPAEPATPTTVPQ